MPSSKLHCQGCSGHIRTIGKSATKKRQTNLILEQGDKNPCPGSRTNPITKSIPRSRSLFTPKALTSRRVQEKSTDRMVGQWRLKGKGYISSDIFFAFLRISQRGVLQRTGPRWQACTELLFDSPQTLQSKPGRSFLHGHSF